MIALLALATAFAADPPCYGHRWPDRLEGEHVWLEWQAGIVNTGAAESLLTIVEDAWDTYEANGWRMPPPSVVVSVQDPILGTAAARCLTQPCGDQHVPIIEVYPGGFLGGRAASVPPHELGHAVQYQYMGSWTDSVRSWEWWMEGCATWMEMQAAPETTEWAHAITGYTSRPQLALHHGAAGLLDLDVSPHLYGTAALALYTEERWGGIEAVQQTWEIGAASTGEPIWFPDVIAEMGIDWDTYWEGYLATIAVNDFERGAEIPSGTRVAREVLSLPTDSFALTEGELPQSLGFNVIRFDRDAGKRNKAVYVELEVDPDAGWHTVLALTTGGASPSRRVVDQVALQERPDGTRFGWMSGFDGQHDVILVVSPEVDDELPDDEHASFDYRWEASRIRDPGPMEPGDALRGCAHGGSGSPWGVALGLALLVRRSRRQTW